MKILICEDEDILLTALEFRMRKAGYEVLLAKNGQDALDLLNQQKVDLVVADIEMPKMTGLELVKKIQELDDPTPVVVISDLEYGEEILQALHTGASDFVAKPFKPAELVLRAKYIFQSKHKAETVNK